MSIGIHGEIQPLSSLLSLTSLFPPIIVATPIRLDKPVSHTAGSLTAGSLTASPLTPAIMFMNGIRPYLYDSLPMKCDIVHLWTAPEQDWIHILEKIEGVQPFMSLIRQYDRILL